MTKTKDLKWERLGVCEEYKAWVMVQTSNSTVVTKRYT